MNRLDCAGLSCLGERFREMADLSFESPSKHYTDGEHNQGRNSPKRYEHRRRSWRGPVSAIENYNQSRDYNRPGECKIYPQFEEARSHGRN
jgi:hypothetical protein